MDSGTRIRREFLNEEQIIYGYCKCCQLYKRLALDGVCFDCMEVASTWR